MSEPRIPAAQPVLGLHHFAYRCRDAEETRHFYEDILGLPLVHVVKEDRVPSTGENCPFAHLFFELGDGSCVAFFDLGDDQAAIPSPNTPPWVNHLALKVPSMEALAAMQARLDAHGIKTVGVTDHEFVKSVYFFDPNGVRLEFAVQTAKEEELKEYSRTAHAALESWNSEKASRRNAKR